MVRVTLSPEDSHVAPAFDDLGGLQGLRSPRGLAYDSARAQLYITDVSAAGMGGACTHQCKQCKRSCRHAAARLTRGDLCRCTACVFVCVCVRAHLHACTHACSACKPSGIGAMGCGNRRAPCVGIGGQG